MNPKDIDDFFASELEEKPIESPAVKPKPVSTPPPTKSSADDFILAPAPTTEPPSFDEPPESDKNLKQANFATQPNLTPADINAEVVLLGAILLDNTYLKEVSLTIEPDDFSLDSHRRICIRMRELYESQRPIDIVTLSNLLAAHKEIEVIGGVAYLASLTEGLPRRPVINEYIKIVKDKSLLRRLMMICSQTIARAADQSETALEVFGALTAALKNGVEDTIRQLSRRNAAEPFFIGYRTFVESAPEDMEWTVEGIIQREGNGLIVGDSGTSKSLLIFDLALHLVAGVAWFHHAIPHRLKVGLVSREDAPGLSQSRLLRLKAGATESLSMFLDTINLNDYLYINTRTQRETWSLQKELDIQEIIEATQERGINFLFFDVFRTLWEGNENDNQDTAKVLDSIKRIGREANCQIALVHHLSKSDRGTIFDRARGGGINGWKEWGIGLTVENPDADPRDQIRKMYFHTKASCASSPICYRIDGYEKMVRLEEVDPPAPQYSFRKGKKKDAESPQATIPYSDN